MNGHNDRDVIAQAFSEQYTIDAVKGPLGGATLFHVANTEVEIVSLTEARSSAVWNDAAKSAEVVDETARRYAAGIAGGSSAQQFKLVFFRTPPGANGPKVCGVLPFVRFSPTNLNGPMGLGTESAVGSGPTQQGMRLAEMVVQGANAKDLALFGAQGSLIHELLLSHRELMRENREQMALTKSFIVDVMQQDLNRRVELLKVERSTKLLLKAADMVPLALPALTGRHLPETMERRAWDDLFLRTSTDAEIKAWADRVAATNPVEGAFIVDRLAQVRAKQREEAGEIEKMKDSAKAVSIEEGAAEVGGLDGPKVTANGHANGAGAPQQPPEPTFEIRRKHSKSLADARLMAEALATGLAEQAKGVEWAWCPDDEFEDVLALEAKEGMASGVRGIVDMRRAGHLVIKVYLPSRITMMANTLRERMEAELDAKLGGVDAGT